MSLRNIGIVYRKELIDSLRDRRTVVSMIVVPLLVMPLLTIGMGVLSSTLVGHGHERNPQGHDPGRRGFPARQSGAPATEGCAHRSREVRLTPRKSPTNRFARPWKFPWASTTKLAAGEPSTVKIYMYEGELRSGFGADRLQRFFRELRDRTVREQLEARQLPAEPRAPVRHSSSRMSLRRKK